MTWKGWILGAGLTAAGCSFESDANTPSTPGVGNVATEGSSGAGDSGPDTGGQGATSGSATTSSTDSAGPTSSTDPSDPTGPPNSSDTEPNDPTTSGDGGPAMLSITGDGFGDLTFNTAAVREYMVTNVGAEPATGLMLLTVGDFVLVGENCPRTLDAGNTCTATVRHEADELGPWSGTLNVSHDDGEASRPLHAEVLGSTGPLIENGGFENCPASGWNDVGVGEWYCGTALGGVPVVFGQRYFAADTGPSNQPFIQRYVVDVSEFSNALATGAMTTTFRGQARTLFDGDDVYRFHVRYQNADAQTVADYDTGPQTGPNWILWEDVRDAPADTVQIVVEIHCVKEGGMYCDAYFDEIELQGTYDGAD